MVKALDVCLRVIDPYFIGSAIVVLKNHIKEFCKMGLVKKLPTSKYESTTYQLTPAVYSFIPNIKDNEEAAKMLNINKNRVLQMARQLNINCKMFQGIFHRTSLVKRRRSKFTLPPIKKQKLTQKQRAKIPRKITKPLVHTTITASKSYDTHILTLYNFLYAVTTNELGIKPQYLKQEKISTIQYCWDAMKFLQNIASQVYGTTQQPILDIYSVDELFETMSNGHNTDTTATNRHGSSLGSLS